MTPEAEEFQATIERAYNRIHEKISKLQRDLTERQNRGAVVVSVIEPLSDEPVKPGDIFDVSSPEGKKHKAEVIDHYKSLARHPELGLIPVNYILAEILDPDRMTMDDFESLYGENEDETEDEEVLQASEISREKISDEQVPDVPEAILCKCGADLHDCILSQEYFGVHVNSYEN